MKKLINLHDDIDKLIDNNNTDILSLTTLLIDSERQKEREVLAYTRKMLINKSFFSIIFLVGFKFKRFFWKNFLRVIFYSCVDYNIVIDKLSLYINSLNTKEVEKYENLVQAFMHSKYLKESINALENKNKKLKVKFELLKNILNTDIILSEEMDENLCNYFKNFDLIYTNVHDYNKINPIDSVNSYFVRVLQNPKNTLAYLFYKEVGKDFFFLDKFIQKHNIHLVFHLKGNVTMNTNISINEVDRLFLKIQKQKQELENKYTCASKILEEKVNKVFSQYFIGELDEIKSKLEIFYPSFQMNNYECFDKETLGICFKTYLIINSLTIDDLYILRCIDSDILNAYNKDLQILLNMICDLEDEKTIDYKDFRYIKSKYYKETYKNFFVKVDDFLQYVQSMLFDCLLGISKVATN